MATPACRAFLAPIALLLACLIITPDVFAIRDEKNQERWERPTDNGPDKVVPGFLINMGPTGARGTLKSNSYVVKYIFKGSPAAGKLKLDDEVYGANGKAFSEHNFGGRNNGIEGPLQDLGLAIEDSEGSDGVLKLMVKRGSDKLTVDIQLEKLGRFADTFPVDCKKTRILRDRAYKYLMNNPGGVNSQGRCVWTLALLSSDDPKVFAAGRKMALEWNKKYNEKTWSWHLGFQGIALSEYHLLTGDKSVLPTIQSTMDLLRYSQWQGKIDHWKLKHFKDKGKDIDQATLDKHQALYAGGFSHAPYPVIVARGGGGYGPMQWPTILAILTWQLGEECDLEAKHPGIDKAFQFLEYGTTAAGHIAYGGEFTLNNGPIDTKRWQASTRHSFSHKSGLGYLAYMLSPERKNAEERKKLHLKNISEAYRDMPDGHACAMMGLTWGLAGVYASDDAELKKKVANYYKAWLNLARCHGSDSYVILPGRDYADYSYYRGNIRNHTTASVAFIYSYANPKLRVQGVRVTIPGVNHTELKDEEAAAYKAICRQAYGAAARLLRESPNLEEPNSSASLMMKLVNERAAESLPPLVALEKEGDWYALKRELTVLERKLRGVESFEKQRVIWREKMKDDQVKKSLLAGIEFNRLEKAWAKSQSDLQQRKLKTFVERYPGTLYTERAKALLAQVPNEDS